MTWVTCHRCHQIPCICIWNQPPFQPRPVLPAFPQTDPEVGRVTWTPIPQVPRLSDEDVDRIAKRVVEVIRERKPETRRAREKRLKQRAANRSRP